MFCRLICSLAGILLLKYIYALTDLSVVQRSDKNFSFSKHISEMALITLIPKINGTLDPLNEVINRNDKHV